VTVALLAAAGASSDETVLEGRYGLFDALGPIPEEIVAALGETLGRSFHLEKPVRGKIYSSCSAGQPALEAMLRLVARAPVAPEGVRSIACDLKPYPLVRDVPHRGYEGRFSMRFCLAVALLHERLEPADFADAMVSNPAIQTIMARIEPAPGAQELVVILADGTRLAEPVQRHPTSIAGWQEFSEKFRRCTAGILAPADVDSAVAAVDDLDRLSSARDLARLVRGSAG
jgi:2-methylcitrate dehydratase PrpD